MTFRPAPGELLAGKYRLEQRIGKGGMGQVWTALHEELDRPVAVKFIDPRLGDQKTARARFFREAKAAARVASRHIVSIYDRGIDGGVPFIVMELLEGEDFAELLARQYRVSVGVAVRVLLQAAKGIEQAHEHGVVHRDLKPRNLFLSREGDDVIVKILDFGVAKADWSKGGETKTGDIVGSPHYMSPEQVHGAKRVDHRTDVWSLAVILFRALTGKRPFPGQGVGEIIVAICTDPPLVASELVPDLPPRIDEFFKRALARDPDKRFQSASEFADTLVRAVGLTDPERSLTWRMLEAEPRVATPAPPEDDDEKTVPTPGSHEPWGESLEEEDVDSPVAGQQAFASTGGPGHVAPAGGSAVPAPPNAPAVVAPPAPHGSPRPAGGSAGAVATSASSDPLSFSSAGMASVPSLSAADPLAQPHAAVDPSLNAPSYGTLASTHQSLRPRAAPRHRPVMWGAGAAAALVLVVALLVMLVGDGPESDGSAVAGSASPAADVEAVPSSAVSPGEAAEPTTAEGGAPSRSSASAGAAAGATASSTASEPPPPPSSRSRPPRPSSPRPGPKRRERLGY